MDINDKENDRHNCNQIIGADFIAKLTSILWVEEVIATLLSTCDESAKTIHSCSSPRRHQWWKVNTTQVSSGFYNSWSLKENQSKCNLKY